MIGSALVSAARRAARLTMPGLARCAGLDLETVRGCETGEVPLYCVPYAELRGLALALSPVRTEAGVLLNYLLIAGQCDLLVGEMLAGSADYAELPPIDAETGRAAIARELLTWAFEGGVPDCYREFARPGYLYSCGDRHRIIEILDELRDDDQGRDLTEFATSLLAMVDSDDRIVETRHRRQ